MYTWNLYNVINQSYLNTKINKQALKKAYRDFMVVQWLRLSAPNPGGLGSIPGQGTRSHMLQAANTWYN